MKTILVPTEDDAAMSSALETALILARRCDSYIEWVSLRWEIAEFTETDHRETARIEVQARTTLESFMRKHGVPRSTTTADRPSFGWLDNAPEGDAFVGNYGRVFDVIVMSRSDKNTTGLHNRAINSGLFESGRPILLAPPSSPDQIGTDVLIAWNRSTEYIAVCTTLHQPRRQQERGTALSYCREIVIPLKLREASKPTCRPCSRRTTPFEFCSVAAFAPPATATPAETAV
jgi:hypothetical protein